MTRTIFIYLLALCIITQSASCQEAKKSSTLDNAQTTEQVEAYIMELAESLRNKVDENEFLKTMGNACLAGGDRLLAIAKDDKAREQAYMVKINGFKVLIQKDRMLQTSSDKESENVEKLDKLIDELEKEGKYELLVNGERLMQFVDSLKKQYQEGMTLEKFEQLKKDVKLWANKKPVPYHPIEPLMIAVQFAESEKMLKTDSNLPEKTTKELIAFIDSAECTIPDEAKKEAKEKFEAYSRRCMGTDLKLYGKTLDNKDFDWASLRGKYVLVKFTASWCGPCRGEIPGMLEAYKKYHDKGFEIVSVYIRDSIEDSKKMVEEEKLPWIILSEEQTVKANLPPHDKTYGIEGVPTMLLIDKDGKIIDTEARGPILQKRLAELFK